MASGDEARPATAPGAWQLRGVGGEAQSVGQGESGASVILYVKRRFGYAKVRYRGLARIERQRLALHTGAGPT